MKIFTFTVYGDPKGKGRPRFTRNGKTYTPKETKEYEEKVRQAFRSSYPAEKPFAKDVPLKIAIAACFRRPKTSMRAAPTVRPDCDNIAKSICDALNGVAYYDDAQIVKLTIGKHYLGKAFVMVRISEITEEDQDLTYATRKG